MCIGVGVSVGCGLSARLDSGVGAAGDGAELEGDLGGHLHHLLLRHGVAGGRRCHGGGGGGRSGGGYARC